MNLSESTRGYLYRVSLALFAVAVVYGIIEGAEVDTWVQLVTAILGVGNAGLATVNTSTKGP